MVAQSIDDWFMQDVIPLEPMLTNFLRRMWRDESEISDLRQEIYARVFEAAGRELPRQVKPFLLQVAHNLVVDLLRRKNIAPLEPMGDLWLNISDEQPTSEVCVAARQELRRLQIAMDDLPSRCRQILVMRKVEGLSQKEVAKRLGVAVDTVDNQVARGMRLLAQAMSDRRGTITAEARRYSMFRRPRECQ